MSIRTSGFTQPSNHPESSRLSHTARFSHSAKYASSSSKTRPFSASTTVRSSSRKRRSFLVHHQNVNHNDEGHSNNCKKRPPLGLRRNSLREEIYRNRARYSGKVSVKEPGSDSEHGTVQGSTTNPGSVSKRGTALVKPRNNFMHAKDGSAQRPVTAPEQFRHRTRRTHKRPSPSTYETVESSMSNEDHSHHSQQSCNDSHKRSNDSAHRNNRAGASNADADRQHNVKPSAHQVHLKGSNSNNIRLEPIHQSPLAARSQKRKLKRSRSTSKHIERVHNRKRTFVDSSSTHDSNENAARRRSLVSKHIGKSLNDFAILEEIGSGGCGTVYKVRSKIDQQIYVAKKVNVRHMSHKQLKDTLSEVYLMKEIRHRHIIQFYTSFVENHSLYILMEHAQSGDLHQYYKQQKMRRKYIKESFLWKIMYQTCLALDYLHTVKKIIHRDVKALNVFLNSAMEVKLGDLGMSRQVSEEQMLQTNVGTPAFLSPEQIKKKPYDFKVDVWGLGCVMYTLAALRPPFRGDNIFDLSRSIVQTDSPSIPKHYSSRLGALVQSMLAKSAHMRPSIQDILMAIPDHFKEGGKDPSNASIPSIHHNNFMRSPSTTQNQREQHDENARPTFNGEDNGNVNAGNANARHAPSRDRDRVVTHIKVKQPAFIQKVEQYKELDRRRRRPTRHRKKKWVN